MSQRLHGRYCRNTVIIPFLLVFASPCHAFNENGFWFSTATDASHLRGTPATLTWSIVPDTTTIENVVSSISRPSDLITDFDALLGAGPGGSDLTLRPWFAQVQASFDRWSAISGVNFVYEPNDDGATMGASSPGVLGTRGDVRLGGTFIDSSGGTLAQAGFVPFADITLDTSDVAHYGNTANNSLTLRNTLMHEIGHSLGFDHNESFNAHILMEPTFNGAYDGPQFDEVLAAHALYGDALEKGLLGTNNTANTATALGTISDGGSVVLGTDGRPAGAQLDPLPTDATDFVSISNALDHDFFSFAVDQASTVDIDLEPVGKLYSESATGFAPFSPVIGTQLRDLALEIYDTDGTSLLATASAGGLGIAESLSDIQLDAAGEYFVRVTSVGGSPTTPQLYELSIGVTAVAAPLLPGDFNTDGMVDAADYARWRNALGGPGDLDNAPDSPGVVDEADLLTWRSNFGSAQPSSVLQSIPEPCGLLLVASALTLASARRNRFAGDH